MIKRFNTFIFEAASTTKEIATAGYLQAAIWLEQERLEEEDSDIGDIEDEELQEILKGRTFEPNKAHLYFDEDSQIDAFSDISKFIDDAGNDLHLVSDWSQVGIDFWLNRNGHGSGFWDKENVYGWDGEADRLSELAKSMGNVDVFINNNGKLVLT